MKSSNIGKPNVICFSIFNVGEEKVFAGDSLKECYNFDLGSVTTADDIGNLISFTYSIHCL